MQTENDTPNLETELKQETGEGCSGSNCSPGFYDTPETDAAQSSAECEDDIVMSMRSLEMRMNDAIQEATNAVNDSVRIAWERNRYKTALEGIAGFPHQYFDGETPWHMRKLAEHALSSENSNLSQPSSDNNQPAK